MIALLIITVINSHISTVQHLLLTRIKKSFKIKQNGKKRGWRFKNKYNIEHQDKPVATVHVHKYLPLSSRDTL